MLQADFIINSAVEPESLDPLQLQGKTGRHLSLALYEGLVRYDAQCKQILPAAADSWTSNQDCSVWTFVLGERYWSDGTLLVADDFVAGCFRSLETESGNQAALPLILSVRGAASYHAGRSRDRSTVGISALNKQTLQFELSGPMTYFPELCADPAFFPFPVHAGKNQFSGNSLEGISRSVAGQYINNGPFSLIAWKPASYMLLEQNPSYRGPQQPSLKRTALLFIKDAEKARTLYGQGYINWDLLDGPHVFDASDISYPANNLYYIAFNSVQPPFDSLLVRKALVAAVDPDALADIIYKTMDKTVYSTQAFSPGSVYPSTGNVLPFNPDKARIYLAEAGYPDSAEFPSFSIICDDASLHVSVVGYLADQWRQQLGLNCVPKVLDRSSFAQAQFIDKNFLLARRGWQGTITDMLFYLEHLLGYVSTEYDELVYTAMRMADMDERNELLSRAVLLLESGLTIIPLFQSAVLNRIDTEKWSGWHANALDLHHPAYIKRAVEP